MSVELKNLQIIFGQSDKFANIMNSWLIFFTN